VKQDLDIPVIKDRKLYSRKKDVQTFYYWLQSELGGKPLHTLSQKSHHFTSITF